MRLLTPRGYGVSEDFNPRTPCGVRHHPHLQAGIRLSNFNPRTPCGVRPLSRSSDLNGDNISIHAPLAGCDYNIRRVSSIANHFNPRTPCGVRHQLTSEERSYYQFQSTHPLRGATHLAHRRSLKACPISIHAPLAGCDLRKWVAIAQVRVFQSTHPLRGATPRP